jgi:hypothetical protein
MTPSTILLLTLTLALQLHRILFRDYGDNCRVVGIADGFGVAEDPKGLDREELLRLVHESLPITSFKKVSTRTCVMFSSEKS